MEHVTEDAIFAVCKEISALATSVQKRLGSHIDSGVTHERILFDSILKITSDRNFSVSDTVELLKTYLAHAPWIGLLVRDSSFESGNPRGGETWALVLQSGILASFAGGPFQTIFEPEYDVHERSVRGTATEARIAGQRKDFETEGERRVRESDEETIHHINCHFGIEFHDGDQGMITTLPDGFRNPLMIEGFANGGAGQEVVAASVTVLRTFGVKETAQWVDKVGNSLGTATSFDILASAALQYHQGQPIVRELRSWTEQRYAHVRDCALTLAAAWPDMLSGTILFASAHHRSWIVIDGQDGKSPLFDRENWPRNVAISRVLAVLSGLQTFRGMTCTFDLSREGVVRFDGASDKIIRHLATDFVPSAQEVLSARYRLAGHLENMGFDRSAIDAAIVDPFRLADLVDPERQILRKSRGADEQRLIENPFSIRKDKYWKGSSASDVPFRSGQDRLYTAIGGDGHSDSYLSDGLWISPDGRISDEGR